MPRASRRTNIRPHRITTGSLTFFTLQSAGLMGGSVVMLRRGVVAVLLLALLHGSTARSTLVYASTDDRAVALVHSAIKKMGGEENLRSLQGVQIERIGHSYSIEQSERPEGPWLVNYEQVTELRDYANQRLRRTTQTRSVQAPQWTPAIILKVADGAAALQFGERSGPAQASDL